jgi:hypothetical protein
VDGNDSPIKESDLREWRLVEQFRRAIARRTPDCARPESWADPRRKLGWSSYLSTLLFALVNPALNTMRALCAATEFERVQEAISGAKISLGSFSEAQHLIEPEFLEKVFLDLARDFQGPPPKDPREAWLQWLAQDSSLWRALPRMDWALYGGGRKGAPNRAVRLHLSFNVLEDQPAAAVITPGKTCERKIWKEQWEKGASYIGDRYYGEDYKLFHSLDRQQCNYIIRLRDESIVEVEEELPLSAEDRTVGITRQAWARLGGRPKYQSARVRVIWLASATAGPLRLVTNLLPEFLSAELVARLYRRRWQVECFFRWLKYLLRSRHWLAESPRGVATQLYLALIAAVLLQQTLGPRPNQRMMEAIQMYQFGWATLDELLRRVESEQQRFRKKEHASLKNR